MVNNKVQISPKKLLKRTIMLKLFERVGGRVSVYFSFSE